MDKQVKFTLIYNPKNRLNRDGRALVYVCAYLSGETRQYFSSGVKLRPDEWDYKCCLPMADSPQGKMHIKTCLSLLQRLIEIETRLRSRGMNISVALIKEEYRHPICTDFHAFVRKRLLMKEDCSLRTRQGRKSVYNSIYAFRHPLSFGQLTPHFLESYSQHLRAQGMKESSVMEYLTILRVFVNRAVKEGYLQAEDNPFRNYRMRKIPSDRTGIDKQYLQKMEKLQFQEGEKQLELTRDLFLFSCYTGLRFSDIMSLRPEHLHRGQDMTYVQIRTQKTHQEVRIPLNLLFEGKALKLLHKYRENDNCFPTIRNNRVNSYLKIIGERLSLPMTLTFHCARHSFASFLAEMGVNPYTLKFLMGHSSIRTSMIYVQTSLHSVTDDLQRIQKHAAPVARIGSLLQLLHGYLRKIWSKHPLKHTAEVAKYAPKPY